MPKGKARVIHFVDGGFMQNVTFEYVNESTVKVVSEDGDVYYYPNSRIEAIYVE